MCKKQVQNVILRAGALRFGDESELPVQVVSEGNSVALRPDGYGTVVMLTFDGCNLGLQVWSGNDREPDYAIDLEPLKASTKVSAT